MNESMNQSALKKCNHYVKEFGMCSQAQGLFVIFKCRDKMNDLNACLNEYNNDTAFDAFKKQKEDELLRKKD